MIKLLKRFFIVKFKMYRLKKIDRECNKYFRIQNKLLTQQSKVNKLISKYESTYEERIRSRSE